MKVYLLTTVMCTLIVPHRHKPRVRVLAFDRGGLVTKLSHNILGPKSFGTARGELDDG